MSATITNDADTDTGNGGGGGRDTGPQVTIVTAADDATPTDQAALETTRRALADRDAQIAQANAAARAAQTDAARHRDEAARLRARSVSDRRAVLGQAIETADSDLAAARVARRTAREAGDYEAENTAEEQITSALMRKQQAQTDLAAMGEPTSGATTDQPAGGNGGQATPPSPVTAKWLNDHPRFYQDPGYQRTAMAVHAQLAQQGITDINNPEAYIQTIEQELTKVYGQNHGHMPNNGGGAVNDRTDHTSSAAPSRGAGGNGGAGGGNSGVVTLIHGLGQVRVRDLPNGGMQMSWLPNDGGKTRDNMEEGAKLTYPDQFATNPQQAIARYTQRQIEIARDYANSGGGFGAIPGEGGVLR